MHVSIIIPVWNGQDTLQACLDSVYEHSGDEVPEVICVDNASSDQSLDLIADGFPLVRVVKEPVNLGFAGAVNEGIGVATGDAFFLLNQDCIVKPGWLPSMLGTLSSAPGCGIVGCLIETPDGQIDHAGAYIHRPDAHGEHICELPNDLHPYNVDYVTGALFGLTRATWESVGAFDDGFYPAYYEESDYCYRARARKIETMVTPKSCVVHYHSSLAWQADPLKYAGNQHLSRYRFVCKHFDIDELVAFFEAERADLAQDRYFSEAVGRAVAARDTLKAMADILRRRSDDLGPAVSSVRRRNLIVGFTEICQKAYSRSKELAPLPFDVQQRLAEMREAQSKEYDLLSKVYFRDPRDQTPESAWHRFLRGVVFRGLSLITGREHYLRSTLDCLQTARMDHMQRTLESLTRSMYDKSETQSNVLAVLDTLLKYEYR